jgi:threonine synthase
MIKSGSNELVPVKSPETLATAIRIGAPVSWKKAVNAIRSSGGTAETVTDEEILAAQKLLAREEGIFVEPASASSIAGLIKTRQQRRHRQRRTRRLRNPQGMASKTQIQQ